MFMQKLTNNRTENRQLKFILREWELTNNLLNTYKELQKFFQKGHEYLEEVVPKIEEKLRESPKQPVFGTDLIRHLRYTAELQRRFFEDFMHFLDIIDSY